jgi:preprotein translocase subunit SecG
MGGVNGAMPGPGDAFGLGLVLVLIGAFLLANSVLFRHPRALVAEHFGGPRERLVSIRGAIFHRLQVHLGFLFLLVGLAVAIYGHYGAGVAEEAGAAGGRGFPKAWVGAIVAAVLGLELGGWWLSHALFLRYVREHFRLHPPALEDDLALARELGELFGIRSEGNDSVQSYLLRIRRRIGLPDKGLRGDPARARARPLEVDGEGEAEEGFV